MRRAHLDFAPPRPVARVIVWVFRVANVHLTAR